MLPSGFFSTGAGGDAMVFGDRGNGIAGGLCATETADLRSALERAGQTHAGCVIERGANEIAYRPWSIDRTSRYKLRCGNAPLELTFSLDEQTGQITSLAAYPPHSSDALCWF